MSVDYRKLGLKVGLEIHQQLNTSTKLFCDCKPGLFKEKPEVTFLRRLRPTQSELGQIDAAAFFEFQKGVRIRYEANDATSCLVEMDEEPPHPLSAEAVETVLMAALMMKAKPVDEIHVMRKTVIDGSNTTGFQRTCVVAMNGEIRVGEKAVPIQHTSLEEDAARKTGDEEGNIIRYRIDRLCIPLIEVATAPVIHSPKEAEEVALSIGGILRATGRAMRGLGTIRQDINVSIPNGALIEIKGVQELELVSLVVEYEVQRQLNLIRIKEELLKAGVSEEELKEDMVDVTEAFRQTKCKVLRKALDRKQLILAVRLPGFSGFLKRELLPGFRLGSEMADRSRFWGRVGGIFHTDEMPAYGVTADEVEALRKVVAAESEDAVVFVGDCAENVRDALMAVLDRAREALKGVPEETRAANADGTTRFMRPRPGAARMYPETDIPPMQITEETIEKARSGLPEMPERKLERLMRDLKLNQKVAKQVLDSGYSELFETIVKESNVAPTNVAVFLTENLKAMKRDGVKIDAVPWALIRDVFKGVGSGLLAKEAVPEVFVWLAKNEGRSVQEAIEGVGLEAVSQDELDAIVNRVMVDNAELFHERGDACFDVLMGAAMKSLRGRADVSRVSRTIKEKMKQKVK